MSVIDRTGLTKKITRERMLTFLERYKTNKKTLDVGCGTALYGNLFPNRTTLDVAARPGVTVDIIADAHNLSMIPDASYEVILCTEVLEHLHTPEKAIAEFHRVLAPGGLLLLTTRFIFPLHDAPGDYYRYTKYGLKHLLREFEIVELTDETNTVETFAVLFQRIGFQCETLWLKPFKMFWFLAAQITRIFSGVLTREYGDIKQTRGERNILSSGYYVAARRR